MSDAPKTLGPSWSFLMASAAVAGVFWGLIDTALALASYAPSTVGAMIGTMVILCSQTVAISLCCGVGVAVVLAILNKLGIHKNDDAIVVFGKSAPLYALTAFVCGSMTGAQVFLYGYTMSSHYGISMVGKHGIGRPMTTALWVLIGLLLITPLVATPLFALLFKRIPKSVAGVWTALLSLQAVNLLFFLYEVSKATLIDMIFFLLIMTLMGWSLPVFGKLISGQRDRLNHKGLAIVLSALGVIGFVGVKLTADRAASHMTKLTVYERSVFAANAFQVLHRVVPAPSLNVPCKAPDVKPEFQPKTRDLAKTEPIQGVVLIMIDALRGDQLRATSKTGKPVMPRLDAYAKESTYFPNAYGTGPGTIRATMSLFYGKYHKPSAVKLPTLMEKLNDHGVTTFSLPTHKNVINVTKAAKIQDNSLVDRDRYRFLLNSQEVYEHSVTFLDKVDEKKPFFQYIHYYDPHEYYVANDKFSYGTSQMDLYQGEVSFTDFWVGKYLDELKRRGLDKRTLVIIMSDHGDEFMEHRYVKHGYRLYDESVRILFVMHDPRQKPSTIKAPTAIVDMPETIAHALGTTMGKQADGVSLLGGKAVEKPLANRPVFLYWRGSSGVVYNRYKLLHHRHQGLLEFYDLDADPKETRNLADTPPEVMRHMGCMLNTWTTSLEKK